MNYINTQTQQYPLSEYEVKSANPNTSFSDVFSAPPGYAPVEPADPPAYDPVAQILRESIPALTSGKWVQQWEVVDLDASAVAANLASLNAPRKSAILAELAAIDTKSIRALRESNTARIAELEAQAVALRAELAAL